MASTNFENRLKRIQGTWGAVAAVAVVATATATAAQAGARNSIPGSRYLAARAAGMADAYLPIADDAASALFYNPAALSSLKSLGAELMNVTFETNNDYVSGFSLTEFYKATSLSSYAPGLSSGAYPGVGMSILPTVYARGFAFGALLQSRLSATGDGTNVSYRSSYRFVPTIGTGLRLANGLFRIGYSLQIVNKAEGEIEDIPLSSSPLGYNQQLNQGTAVSHNLGVNIALPIAWLPTLSVVARNVGSARFRELTLLPLARNPAGVPATEPMTIDAALGLQPKLAGGKSVNLVFQVKDLTAQSGFSILDRFTAGAEFSIRSSLALRLGYGLGSGLDGINAGLGYQGKRGNVSLAWYREELGTPSASDAERRWILQYQVRAF